MTHPADTDHALQPNWPGNAPWQPLPDAALTSFRIAWGILGLVIGLGSGVIPAGVAGFANGFDLQQLVWAVAALLVAVVLCQWQAQLRWKNTRWRLDDDGLRVRRGRFWRSEILIPRVRVQHLDIERGPIERRLGLATLVVHTAGTRMHALRQPGFDEQAANALRDALVPAEREPDDHA